MPPKKKVTASKVAAPTKKTTPAATASGAASGSNEKAPAKTKHDDDEWDGALPVKQGSYDFNVLPNDREEEEYTGKGKGKSNTRQRAPTVKRQLGKKMEGADQSPNSMITAPSTALSTIRDNNPIELDDCTSILNRLFDIIKDRNIHVKEGSANICTPHLDRAEQILGP